MRAQLLFWSARVITSAAIHFGQFEWQIRNVWAFHLLGFFSFENMLAMAAPPSSSASAAGAGEFLWKRVLLQIQELEARKEALLAQELNAIYYQNICYGNYNMVLCANLIFYVS